MQRWLDLAQRVLRVWTSSTAGVTLRCWLLKNKVTSSHYIHPDFPRGCGIWQHLGALRPWILAPLILLICCVILDVYFLLEASICTFVKNKKGGLLGLLELSNLLDWEIPRVFKPPKLFCKKLWGENKKEKEDKGSQVCMAPRITPKDSTRGVLWVLNRPRNEQTVDNKEIQHLSLRSL